MEGEACSSMNLLWFARKQCLNTPTLAIEKPLSGTSPLLSLYFFLRHGPLLELPSGPFTQTLNISSMKNAFWGVLFYPKEPRGTPQVTDDNLQREH